MIDVVVPCYGQLDLVSQCVSGLLAQKDIGQLILVDDAHPGDEIAEFCAAIGQVRYFRLIDNMGFVGAVNFGMSMVETEYAVIVNSDTVPDANDSLRSLIYLLHDHRMNIGGPKLLFMNGSKYGHRGTIQHAGVAFGYNGVPYHPFMHLHRRTEAANVVRRVNAVTGAVLAVRTEVWRSVGGFDAEFAPGVFEDIDFCLKAGKVAYVSHSEWWHLMHGSQTDEHNLFDNEREHLDRLLRRWGVRSDEEIFYGGVK